MGVLYFPREKANQGGEMNQERCPNCGKYVPHDDGYVTPDWPEWEFAPFRACCDKNCSDKFEAKHPEQVAEWKACSEAADAQFKKEA